MLRPTLLLARALRRPAAGVSARTLLRASWSAYTPRTAHRHASIVSRGGSDEGRKTPSFAIAAAFEGHEDLEDDGGDEHLYGYQKDTAGQDEQEKALKDQFWRGVEKKKLWMQTLAAQKLYAAVVKSVADCYAPLYAAMGLEGRCPLLAVANSEANAETELVTQFQPLRYDDLLTKVTEQEAMALLMIAKLPKLAMTIIEHREKLAKELEKRRENGVGVVLSGMEVANVVTLGLQTRSFYSWAMGAYAMAGSAYHSKLYQIYKLVQDGLIYPTANMNVQYAHALITEKRYDEVLEFYDLTIRDNIPVTVYFYRQLLTTLFLTRNIERLKPMLDDMRIKGFKLRPEDYLKAIRTFDDVYFLRDRLMPWAQRKHVGGDEEPQKVTPVDTYFSCVKRMREQEDNPEEFEELMDAAQNVLALFDTMVDVDGLSPRDEALFSRVITAAVIAQEFERVPELLALHAEHSEAHKPLNYVGVRMAVNALLLLDKPTEAWGLVREMCPDLKTRQHAHVANILEYLSLKKRGSDIIALMHDLEKLDALTVFSNAVIKRVMPALCRSCDNVNDEELVETINHFGHVFGTHSNAHQLGVFLRECCYNGRIAPAKAVLQEWMSTKGNKRPIRKPSLAIRILETIEKAPDGEVDWEFMTQVFDATDFFHVNTVGDLEAIVNAAVHAYEALDQPEGIRRVRGVAAKRQRQLQQHSEHFSKQEKKGIRQHRKHRTDPANDKTVMINGIPVISSSA